MPKFKDFVAGCIVGLAVFIGVALLAAIVLGLIALPIWGLLLLITDVNYFTVFIILVVLWLIKISFFNDKN